MNEATTTARMTAEPLRLLYADEWFVAVHKPEGLLVHRSPLDRLAFPHPFTGERLDIFCPPEESFLAALRALGGEETAGLAGTPGLRGE